MNPPISEQIALNVVAAIRSIDGTGDYYTVVSNVIRNNGSMSDVTAEDRQIILTDKSIKLDKKIKPPWGQVDWSHLFDIRCFIRSVDGTPISQRINFARADVERALMIDPRRDGLCWVDNEIADIETIESSPDGIYAFSVLLLCEYRTLRGQPNVLAPSGGNEQYFQGGAVVLLAPYTSARTLGSWRRLQDLRVMPSLDPDTESIESDRNDGLSRKTDILFSGHKLKFTVEADYQNADILAWRFGGTQSSLQSTAISTITATHLVAPDSVVPLHDANGNPAFPVSSVSAGSFVAGQDFIADPASLSQGIILIPPGSAMSGAVSITFTTVAYSSRPAFIPATDGDTRYRCRIIWEAGDGQQLVYGDFDASVVATQTTSEPAIANTTTFTIAALDDGSSTPCGKFIQVAGPVPSVGY